MSEPIHQILDTPHKSHLVVENIKGPVTVTGWDRPQTEITAIPDQAWVEVEITQHEQEVIARTKAAQGNGKWASWFGTSRTPRVEYTVSVPRATDLTIRNVTGPILVQHCQGKLSVRNVDGNVTLEDTHGEVDAETVNGVLLADQSQGVAHLKTVNGTLTVQDSALSRLSAHTVNGRIKAAATWTPDAQISLHSVNGDCEVLVPADFRARASAHGVNVKVTLGQDESIKRQFSGWHGTIGPEGEQEPTAQISFHTVNGHLLIDDGAPAADTDTQLAKRGEQSAPTAPETEVIVKTADASAQEAQAAEAPPRTQLDVLQMVERGELSVDEALKLLGS
jgi:ribosomal protein S28E/S33